MIKSEQQTSSIDIREDYLLKKDNLLDIFLQDKTTGKNILWATDSYESKGEMFAPDAEIKAELVTGEYGSLIQPRAIKRKSNCTEHEISRGIYHLSIVKQMNEACDTIPVTENNWQEYVAC
ncbi:MAG: hypothetical protein IPG55_05185 [Saprospiraceae bacterium]|nr:hypothetical protein [Candidatus Defluviibacterium haderslevense]